jgi:hypothetical protein
LSISKKTEKANREQVNQLYCTISPSSASL